MSSCAVAEATSIAADRPTASAVGAAAMSFRQLAAVEGRPEGDSTLDLAALRRPKRFRSVDNGTEDYNEDGKQEQNLPNGRLSDAADVPPTKAARLTFPEQPRQNAPRLRDMSFGSETGAATAVRRVPFGDFRSRAGPTQLGGGQVGAGLADRANSLDDGDLEAVIRQYPGQKSGVSTTVGSEPQPTRQDATVGGLRTSEAGIDGKAAERYRASPASLGRSNRPVPASRPVVAPKPPQSRGPTSESFQKTASAHASVPPRPPVQQSASMKRTPPSMNERVNPRAEHRQQPDVGASQMGAAVQADEAPAKADDASVRKFRRKTATPTRFHGSALEHQTQNILRNGLAEDGSGTERESNVKDTPVAATLPAVPVPARESNIQRGGAEAAKPTAHNAAETVVEGPPLCCFCHRPADDKALAGLGKLEKMDFMVTDRKKREVYLYYHEACAAFGGGMAAIPTTVKDVEHDVVNEWKRSSLLQCMQCKALGRRPTNRATLGCCHPSCRVSLHYTCARELAAQRKIFFANGPREIVCLKHKRWYMKNCAHRHVAAQEGEQVLEQEWLGMWMEGSGGWNGVHSAAKEEWEALGLNVWPGQTQETLENAGDMQDGVTPRGPPRHKGPRSESVERKSADLNSLMQSPHLNTLNPQQRKKMGAESARQDVKDNGGGSMRDERRVANGSMPPGRSAGATQGLPAAQKEVSQTNGGESAARRSADRVSDGAVNSASLEKSASRRSKEIGGTGGAPPCGEGRKEAVTSEVTSAQPTADITMTEEGQASGRPPMGRRPSSSALVPTAPAQPVHPFPSLALTAVEKWRELRIIMQRLPRPASAQIMGHAMSNELAAAGRAAMASAVKDCNRPGKLPPSAVYIVAWDDMAWTAGINFTAAERSAVEAGVRGYLQPFANKFAMGETLPKRLPLSDCQQSSFIGKTDPRIDLRSQECIRSTEFVPRGTVIGTLGGTLQTLEEHHGMKYCAEVPAGTPRKLWNAVHSAYTLELTSPDMKRAFPWIPDHLVLSMVREANLMSLINDPSINPLSYNSPTPLQRVSPPNVAPLVVSFLGFPLVLVVAICDITPYQELLYCYGREYWAKLREALRAMDVADE